MNISGKRMYELLKKLNFVRLSTTDGETKAAGIIADEVRALGTEPVIETFNAPHYEIKTAKLAVTSPFEKEYKVTGYGFSGNAAKDGIEAELKYLDGYDAVSLQDVKGKIVLVWGKLGADEFEKLIKAGAIGFISVAGTFRDEKGKTDLDERMLRPAAREKGVLPGVCVHINDAKSMIEKGAKRVRMTLEQEEGEADSRNVIAEIPGTQYPDEVIVYTAHYDSVVFSRGMFDNATGSATILELFRYYLKNPPKRTVRFIWCGSEERGLLGSKAYVAAHEELLGKIGLCINVDMTGPLFGRDCARVTGEEGICRAIEFMYKEIGFPVSVWQDTYSSDCIPFADKGIPAVSFLRQAADGLSHIHCRDDVITQVNAGSLARTVQFIEFFSDRVINSAIFPIERKMPDNMVEKINKYLGKKPETK